MVSSTALFMKFFCCFVSAQVSSDDCDAKYMQLMHIGHVLYAIDAH